MNLGNKFYNLEDITTVLFLLITTNTYACNPSSLTYDLISKQQIKSRNR
jgi:hypothetical protein